jgi:hypothetical protein
MSFLDRRVAAALLLLCSTGVTVAQTAATEATPQELELREQIRKLQAQVDEQRVADLKAVTVNGETLPPEVVLREAIYLVGAKQVEARIADFFIEEHLQEAISGGRDKKEFEVTDDEIVKDIEKIVEEFRKQNPGIEFWEAVRAQFGMDKDRFLHTRRQTILFDRVFFPGPANGWPVITREAIIASASGGDGKGFWDNLEKASVNPTDGAPRELPAFWMQLCRGWVQKQLKTWSDIRYPSDGLPQDVCLRVNGKDWKTSEAFELVRHGLYTQDVERAMTEVVIREALKQELAKAGNYMSDDEFRAQFDEYRKQFDETPFTTEVIAVNFKGYPSLEAFRQRWRLMRSYERMIEKEINDDNLKAHAQRFSGFFGDGQVNVDVIQLLARDSQTGAWITDGHAKAEERAKAVMTAIEGGLGFDDALTQKGEYYANDKERGRLGAKSLNQLRQQIRETEFTDLLNGYSIGHFLFYEAEPQKVYGPLHGPEGWFIARVNARTPARTQVTVDNDRTRELVKQDYVSYRFMQWANEVVAKSDIR